ncbi:collagen alpha-1(II) chain-like [Rhipicephalus sanguineus]|uniref:collagen alpha-1(II) chain-like n=1 Tax=Rhipicephalus sanguineus TaxID=34632 RepID=UPI0020C322FB|nr:collagen alpha-1(II) chain-like [Rhipicephalus sanguineus]
MAKAKKSRSGGKSKKHKHGSRGKKGKSGSRGKKSKSAGKGKKDRSGREEKDELEDKEDKTESKGSKHKAGGKGKKKKHGSKGKKGKSGSKGSKGKHGSKGKKHKHGSKGKKHKHGSKGKKHKPGSKGKKGKHGSKGKKGKSGGKGKKHKSGGKAKKGSGDGSPFVKKSEKSSTPDSATGSVLGRASAASSEGLFKPRIRRPFSPLVLPADRQLTTVRRPTTIYIWNWDNVWFFPMGVVAMSLVVLGMVLMSLNVQEADELQAEDAMNATDARNVTTAAGVVTQSRPSRIDVFGATSHETFKIRRKKAHARIPSSKTDIMDDDDTTTQAWVDAPIKGSQGTSRSISPSLIQVTTSKGVDTDAWAQNLTAVNDDEV